jgi:hypothetical protein
MFFKFKNLMIHHSLTLVYFVDHLVCVITARGLHNGFPQWVKLHDKSKMAAQPGKKPIVSKLVLRNQCFFTFLVVLLQWNRVRSNFVPK